MPQSDEVTLVQPLSLSEQVAAARSGDLSLQDLIAQTLDRLDEVNPLVRAILPDIRLRERLSSEAADIIDRWPTPSSRPPLFGAMVAVKDIFNVSRMPTRAGSAVPPESFSGREADVVARLKEAGALVLGKAVTTEFAYFASGATANPHNREHTPGGSSSGSAAAVAAGIAPLALGSQTVGSVIRPATFCGVVGFKPSYDRIPTGGTRCTIPRRSTPLVTSSAPSPTRCWSRPHSCSAGVPGRTPTLEPRASGSPQGRFWTRPRRTCWQRLTQLATA